MNKGYILGRFTPLHNGHIELIDKALHEVDDLTIILGSPNRGTSLKNPFSVEERKHMIQKVFPTVKFDTMDDMYDTDLWTRIFKSKTKDGTVFGFKKSDGSSDWVDYLDNYVELDVKGVNISATDVREIIYTQQDMQNIHTLVHPSTYEFIASYDFNELIERYKFCENYKRRTSNVYGEVVHTTVDALITTHIDFKEYILLINRGGDIGKDQWALAGGFLEHGERLLIGAKREACEETGVNLDGIEPTSYKYYDAPDRDDRGHIITHVYKFYVDVEKLANMVAGDDAKEVRLFPYDDIKDLNMYGDHKMIIMDSL